MPAGGGLTLHPDTQIAGHMTLEGALEVVFWGQVVVYQRVQCWYGYAASLRCHLLIPLLPDV